MCKKSFKSSQYKHGQFGTRIYNTWAHMKQRCYNPKNASYCHYGAKGIKVCEEWQEFIPFYEWSLANGYADNLSIDRIDRYGDYEPSNCRWATIEQQNNNKGDTRLITYKNKTQSIAQWAKELNISYQKISRRLNVNMELDKIFIPQNLNKRYITYNNETHTLTEWSKILKIERTTLAWRLKRMSIKKAFTKPLAHAKVHQG